MIITIGGASKDVFLKGKIPSLKLGNKYEINEIFLETGGGGTNTAVSFSRLGFKTAFMGKIGLDISGIHIIKELKKNKVDISLIKTSKLGTGYSVVASPYGKDRIIFVYRGANVEIEFKPIKANLYYIASLTGKSENIINKIINYAKKNKIKVAMNPSKVFLKKHKRFFVNILLLNKTEANILVKNLKNLNDYAHIAVVTKGKQGCEVYTKQYKYEANSPFVKIKETTGAGDAFCSGFVAGLIKKDIEFGIKLGTLNACSCIQEIGAKNGLISWNKVKKSKGFMDKVIVKKTKL